MDTLPLLLGIAIRLCLNGFQHPVKCLAIEQPFRIQQPARVLPVVRAHFLIGTIGRQDNFRVIVRLFVEFLRAGRGLRAKTESKQQTLKIGKSNGLTHDNAPPLVFVPARPPYSGQTREWQPPPRYAREEYEPLMSPS